MVESLGRLGTTSPSVPEMDTDPQDEQKGDVSELVRRLRTSRPLGSDAWGGGIVLIGAGCSVSAGIPISSGVIDIALRHIAIRARLDERVNLEAMQGEAVYNLLKSENLLSDIDAQYGSALYSELFEKILTDATQEREVIREAIDRSGGRINWAHLRLGQLVKAHCVHTILTTNFDQLALEGLVRNGILPAVADGIEALNRVDPRPKLPQLVHIHGSLHNYRRINSTRQLEDVGRNGEVYRSISSLLRDAPFLLIVGYRGEENGLITPLTEALSSFDGKPVYWTFYGQEPSKAAKDLQKRGKVKLLFGQDADRLFDSLANGLNLGLPEWMGNPVATLNKDFDKIVRNEKISGLVTVFEKHAEKLTQLQICWNQSSNQTSDASSEARFAAAILAGELQIANNQIGDGPNAVQRRALLAKAAANAFIDQKQEAAAQILLDCWERLGTEPTQHFTAEDTLRIAEAFLERDAVEMTAPILEKIYPSLHEKRSKLYWSNLQHRLGFKLTRKFATTDGKPRLEDAIKAYRAALQERTRENSAAAWANTKNNLGTALSKLGRQEDNIELITEAINVFQEALEIRTRDQAPIPWASTNNNLALALTELGARTNDATKITEAVAIFHEVLIHRTRESDPQRWAGTQGNLAFSLWMLGSLEGSVADLKKALMAADIVREVRSRENAPLQWARSTELMAGIENTMGDVTQDAAHWRAALAHIEGALEEYRTSVTPNDIEDATELRDDLMAKLSL